MYSLVFTWMFLFGTICLTKSHNVYDITDTTPEIFPYHALIHGKMICNGILITEEFVITPAYCVYGSPSVTVYLGFHGYPYYTAHHSEPHTQVIRSSHIYIHEDFSKIKDQHYLNNIALVKLATPAKLYPNCQPGKLLSRGDTHLLGGTFATVSGWLVSKDEDLKSATVQIRNEDTCSYLFGNQFLRSQQLCIKWLSKNRLNLLGNAVSIDGKIVGFQTNTPECQVQTSTCTRNDMILSLEPFLDWISHKVNVPIEEFTKKESHHRNNDDVYSKIEYLVKVVEEIKEKFATDLGVIDKKVDGVISELEKNKLDQQNYALSLNEQIGDLRSEINNSRSRENQTVLGLREEINGARTELMNALAAQNIDDKIEAKISDINTNVINKTEDRISMFEMEINELSRRFKRDIDEANKIISKQQDQITEINKNVDTIFDKVEKNRQAVDEKFEYINSTVQEVLSLKGKFSLELDEIRRVFKEQLTTQYDGLVQLKHDFIDGKNDIHKQLFEGGLRINNIEKEIGKQRDDISIQVELLWKKIGVLFDKVEEISKYIDIGPRPS